MARDGNSSNGDYPSLAGQVPGYIAQQLANFKSGIRGNIIMGGMAQTLTEEDMANLDAWYSSQQPTIYTLAEDQLETAQLGETLYRGGYPPRQVPACMGCHGPAGSGIPPIFPRLAGQHAKYTETQLLAFKAEQRRSEIMSSDRLWLVRRTNSCACHLLDGSPLGPVSLSRAR